MPRGFPRRSDYLATEPLCVLLPFFDAWSMPDDGHNHARTISKSVFAPHNNGQRGNDHTENHNALFQMKL